MKEILIFFVAHWYLSLFFQTFFLHRYASHRAFTMNKFTERVFFVLTWIFQGIDPRFTKDIPEWNWFDKMARSWVSRIMWGALYVAFYYNFATEWWLWLLLPAQFLLSPIHGAIINWFAHKYGYINFKVGDTSKNFLPFDFLMMGESYHNNHHKHGNRAKFGGFRWHEIDPTYLVIKVLDKIGIIKINKYKEEKVPVKAVA